MGKTVLTPVKYCFSLSLRGGMLVSFRIFSRRSPLEDGKAVEVVAEA